VGGGWRCGRVTREKDRALRQRPGPSLATEQPACRDLWSNPIRDQPYNRAVLSSTTPWKSVGLPLELCTLAPPWTSAQKPWTLAGSHGYTDLRGKKGWVVNCENRGSLRISTELALYSLATGRYVPYPWPPCRQLCGPLWPHQRATA
jgi:hypothetical protein